MNTRNLRFRSNRMRDIIALYHEELDALYGSGEVGVFIEMLCDEYLGWDRVRLLLNKEQTIDQSDLLRFHWALEDLLRHRPIQHIVGHTDFCGCRIDVSPAVLIPRPETEEMVEWLGERLKVKGERYADASKASPHPPFTFHLSPFTFLDLCTGSGCIAIALKRAFPRAEVTAVDISREALAVARRNAAQNNTEINFQQADILSDTFHLSPFTFHLIVSNPPYVLDSERAQMAPNVLDYDPPQALFVPDSDPLHFYRAIAAIASRSLAPGGMLAVEINEALADQTAALLADHGLTPTIHTDFRSRPRWIGAELKWRQGVKEFKETRQYHQHNWY